MTQTTDYRSARKKNAVRCLKCGDIIESKHRHDFVTCSCGNVSVDGGSAYKRRCFKSDQWEEVTT